MVVIGENWGGGEVGERRKSKAYWTHKQESKNSNYYGGVKPGLWRTRRE